MERPVNPDPLRLMAAEPHDGFGIWLRYADGVEGEVHLSHLIGKGAFAAWRDPDFFSGVHAVAGGGIDWSEEIDLCPDALYLQITGKSPDDIWPGLKARTKSPDAISCEEGTATSKAEVSRFCGIDTRIHGEDHDPPHIHAGYGEAAVGIPYFGLLPVTWPPRAFGLVVEWVALHQEELLAAWGQKQRGDERQGRSRRSTDW